ncbi:hypothetical protein L1049_020103 [Liquidambar formosana]|uniref:CRC domain-containing protein n=1 Tax=Liquidambar formosana TaxID=63359 RepID=A0AAP0SDI2_LIQFO
MDTPEKNQIGTPISEFEDSPVFNYINSLSPIKPVKAANTAQIFPPLSFASPPSSVFTSPHINSQRESRVSRRLSDISRPEFSHSENEDNTSEGVSDAVQLSDLFAEQLGCHSPGRSSGEITSEPPCQNLKSELPKTLSYDYSSLDGDMVPYNVVKTNNVPEMAGTPASPIQFVQDVSEERHHSFESEIELRGICRIEQNKETAGCDWENLISNATDLLISDSSINNEHYEGQDYETVDAGVISFISAVLQLPQDDANDLKKTESDDPVGSCKLDKMEEPVTQPGVGELKVTDQASAILPSTLLDKLVVSDLGVEVDDKGEKCIRSGCKSGSQQQQRSIRRRCLVFDMAGAHKKKLLGDPSGSSMIKSQSDRKDASNEKQLVLIKPGNGYSSSILPGIGLHLNALATTSKDCKVVQHQTLASGRQLIMMPSSVSSFSSLTSDQKPSDKSSTLTSLERDLVPHDNETQVMEDVSQTPAFGVGEEFNHSCPKRKRRRLEHNGESEGCKRCSCKKSKCLKLYCECFAAGLYCIEPCLCQDCFNKPIHEDKVLETRKQIESRNPLAFAPKVISSTNSVPEFGDESNNTPASARHKRGCNCKKSNCLKKYCECFQAGVGCSINCRCKECRNSFGGKDGVEEADIERNETEACETSALDISFRNNEKDKCEEESPDHVTPITPSSKIGRPSVQLPFTFSGKPTRSSSFAVGSSLQSCTSQKLETSDFLCRQPKFRKLLQMIPEDETPEILVDDCSPVGGVKSASPNCKRVSPPHHRFGSSPAWRRGRKLILRSIPSFPSPNPPNKSSDLPGKLQ